MTYFEPPQPDYSQYSNKKLLAIPIAIFVLAVLLLIGWTVITGVPVERGLVFTGGTEVRITVSDSVDNPQSEIQEQLSAESESIVSIPGTNGYIVTFAQDSTTPDEIEADLAESDSIQISELSQLSADLGDDAQLTALYGIGIAFILMSILVIILFRSLIPAIVILLSAISNIVVALAAMNIFGITLSLGTVGALLMLIGYSVDSDILLNTHVIREDSRDTFIESVHKAMGTGITMTITSMSAMIVMFITATIFGIGLLAEMGFVLAVGLGMDLINTYLMNVSLLRWYTGMGDSP